MILMDDKTKPVLLSKTTPEIICIAVTLCLRFPLYFRNVEDFLQNHEIDVGHESLWFCWNKFEPICASDIRCKGVN